MNPRHIGPSSPIAVFSGGIPGYAAATAELPFSTRRQEDESSDIVVIDAQKEDWLAAAHKATAEDATQGIVVVDPGSLTPRRAEELVWLSERIPLLVDRPHLPQQLTDLIRTSLGELAVRPFYAVVASAAAPQGQLDMVLRDLLGWVRELATSGSDVRVEGAHGSCNAVAARVTWSTPDGRQPAVVGVHEAAAPMAAQIDLLGEARTRLRIGSCHPVHDVLIESESGSWSPPPDFESRERGVLRRATTVMAGGEHPPDARDLAADLALMHHILSHTQSLHTTGPQPGQDQAPRHPEPVNRRC